MAKRIKNLFIFLFSIIVIFILFRAPEEIFKILDERETNKIYKIEKTESKIDVEAEKIYLVRAIHDMNKGSNAVSITQSKEPEWKILNKVEDKEQPEKFIGLFKEILKLQECHILGKVAILDSDRIAMNIINTYYKVDNDEYKYMMRSVFAEDKTNIIGGEIEEKTGKLLYVVFEKEDIIEELSAEEIMRNYVRYLDLYIIDDWKYEDEILKSEKAQLVVSLKETLSSYILKLGIF